MKLNIDTDAKVINVDGQVSLNELVNTVKKMFPDDWKDYKIDAVPQTIIQPTLYDPWKPQPITPWWETPYTWCDSQIKVSDDGSGSIIFS